MQLRQTHDLQHLVSINRTCCHNLLQNILLSKEERMCSKEELKKKKKTSTEKKWVLRARRRKSQGRKLEAGWNAEPSISIYFFFLPDGDRRDSQSRMIFKHETKDQCISYEGNYPHVTQNQLPPPLLTQSWKCFSEIRE